MKREPKPQWEKRVLPLNNTHSWKAPAGYAVFVADRGAVRFNIPTTWVVQPAADCVEIFDQTPPDDDCRLAVSYLRLPPLDWSGLPLSELIVGAAKDNPRNVTWDGDIITVPRADLEVAWREGRFVDPKEKRAARSRFALARGWNLQALITLDFWETDLQRVTPVWNEVLRPVELGRYVADPQTGDVVC